jgi:hypothetical protein
VHHGFIVARSDWPSLHAALEARCGELNDSEEISPQQWFDVAPGQDVFHVASSNGTTYVLDPMMVLSTDSDLITDLARELSCLVVGAGGETVSGTFWFTAAEGPALRRPYFNVLETITSPGDRCARAWAEWRRSTRDLGRHRLPEPRSTRRPDQRALRTAQA